MSTAPDDRYPGKYLGHREHKVDAEAIRRYIDATGDDNPWYRDASPWGYPVAPALLFHSEAYAFPAGDWYLPNLTGNLHVKQEWRLFRPIRVGRGTLASPPGGSTQT